MTELADGEVLVRGRCVTLGRWVLAQRLGLVFVVAAGLWLLASATFAWWGPAALDAAEGTRWFRPIRSVLSVRWVLRDLLNERFPAVGEAIGYDHRRPLDWHLGAVGLVLLVGRHTVAHALAGLVFFLLHLIAAKRFRIRITRDTVRFGGVPGATFARDDNGPEPVRFRVVRPEEYHSRFKAEEIRQSRVLRPLAELPPAVVELTHGFNRRKVLFARRVDRAEAIVARCNEALLRTSHSLPHLDG